MKVGGSRKFTSVVVALIVVLVAFAASAEQVATSTEGMVATAHELASQAGAEILALGGNAIDAAAFAITVVEPNASSLGGEGMMILSLADGRDIAIDYRSVAPGHITYEDDNDEPRVRAFTEDIFAGRLHINAPWEVWHPTFHWATDRTVLKIIQLLLE